MGTRKRAVNGDAGRNERIEMKIIVDTYSADERVMGWYAYLDDTLAFPFDARCIEERAVSPLTVG